MIDQGVDRREFMKLVVPAVLTAPAVVHAAGTSLLLLLAGCKDSSRSPGKQAWALWKVPRGTSVARATELALGNDPATGTPNIEYRGDEVVRIGGKKAYKDPSGTNQGNDEGFHYYIGTVLDQSGSPRQRKLSSGIHTISWVFVDRFDQEVGGPIVAITVEVV